MIVKDGIINYYQDMAERKKPSRSELSTFEKKIFKELEKKTEISSQETGFISRKKIHIRFSDQKFSGARWTLFNNIFLNSRTYSTSTDPADPGLLSLVLHELHHMRQGLLTAMSVYGELDAWQVGFRFYQKLTGKPLKKPLIELLEIPLSWSRQDLVKAKQLMKEFSPGYRIDWYPLYPIHREIIWLFTHRQPPGPSHDNPPK
jgi:hypothetical protein